MRLIGWKWRLLMISALVLLVYIGIVGLFYVKEDSFVYYPRQGLRTVDSVRMGIETVRFATPDSVQLVGWIIPAAPANSSGLWFLYFHGNGGNISSRGYVAHYKAFQQMGITTFAVDYRGYGLSSGSPSEMGFYTDARAAFMYLVHVRQVPSHNIIIFGYSLGSAVAIELATNVDAGGLIVEGALMSAPAVGQRQYPFLPVNVLMKNRFDSISRIQHVDEPKLFLHATLDEVIPFGHSKELFAAAREPKMFVETKGGHNTVHMEDSLGFYGGILKFLEDTRRSHRAEDFSEEN